ncbi:MAG: hypothetical protein H8D94_01120 [Candidatus Pelagibacter sp.]|nr:hypothetical protein [Candidatus Pelagibacter sp.]
MAKQSKNLQKVQDMLDGTYGDKIQSGYSGETEEVRKVGDVWVDSDGKTWEQKNGYKSNITKLASSGIADKCTDCEKFIFKKWDKDVFFWNKRCYYCQIDFEAELRTNGKYEEWHKAKTDKFKDDFIKKFEEDNEDLIKEIENLSNPFDKGIANALANENVDEAFKVNKRMID